MHALMPTWAHALSQTNTWMRAHTHTHTHTHTLACMHMCTHKYTHTHTCERMYMCTHRQTDRQTDRHTHTHTHTHTRTHTQQGRTSWKRSKQCAVYIIQTIHVYQQQSVTCCIHNHKRILQYGRCMYSYAMIIIKIYTCSDLKTTTTPFSSIEEILNACILLFFGG